MPRPETDELGIALTRLRVVMLAVPMLAVVSVEVVNIALVPVALMRFKYEIVEEEMTVEPRFVWPVTARLVEVTLVTKVLPRLERPTTAKLVVVALVKVEFANTVLVVKVIAPLLNCMSGVPVTEVGPL